MSTQNPQDLTALARLTGSLPSADTSALDAQIKTLNAQIKAEERKIDFVTALKIAEGVMEKYREEQPKWWKRMDGTPILNDLPVRMAEAFSLANMKDQPTTAPDERTL